MLKNDKRMAFLLVIAAIMIVSLSFSSSVTGYYLLGSASFDFTPGFPDNGSVVTTNHLTVNITNNFTGNVSSFIDFNRSLVGYWSFDSANATGVFDNSTWSNFGTFNGGLDQSNLTTGKFGNAIVFDGSNDKIEVNDSSSLNTAGNYTVEFWIKPLRFDYRGLISKIDSSDRVVSAKYILWLSDTIGNIWHGFGDTSSYVWFEESAGLGLNEWNYVADIWNGTHLSLYVNGNLVNSRAIGISSNPSTGNPITIGGSRGGASINASIDDVRIWNRALSTTEINASYNSVMYPLSREFTDLSGSYELYAYATDSYGNANKTDTRYLTFTQVPQYLSVSVNTTLAGESALFSTNWTDLDGGISGYIFSTNNTGVWVNDSYTTFGYKPIIRVQGNAKGYSATSTLIVNMTYAPTEGNMLILAYTSRSGGATIPSPISNISQTGVTWIKQVNKTLSTSYTNEIWAGIVGAGASPNLVVNINGPISGGAIADVCEYSGLSTSDFLDQTATNTSAGAITDTGFTSVTTQTNELWVGSIGFYGDNQTDAINNFTLLDGNQSGSMSLAYLEKIVSTTGIANSGTSSPTGHVWTGVIATFKAAPLTTAWSNVTKTLNSTPRTTIGWKVFANDTANSWNILSSELTTTSSNPLFSSNDSQLVEYYMHAGYSNFSVTWNSEDAIAAYIENDFAGVFRNDTMSGSYPNYYYNSTVLGAGTYHYRFIANDTTGNENATNEQVFVISPGAQSISLIGIANDTYPYAVTPVCSGNVTSNLFLNGTSISNNTQIELGAGTYIWTCNTTLNSNYTFNSVSIAQDVTKRDANIGLSPATQSIEYGNSVTQYCTGNVACSLYRNGTLITNDTAETLSSGLYVYVANISDTANYTNWNSTSILTIVKGSQAIYLVNNTSLSGVYPYPISMEGLGNSTPAELLINGTAIASPYSELLAAGAYNFTWVVYGDENYANNSTTAMLTITKGTASPVLSNNLSWAGTYPSISSTSCSVSSANSEVPCSLYRDGVLVSNQDEAFLGAGSYTYKTNTSETENYTANATGQIGVLLISPYSMSLSLTNSISWSGTFPAQSNTTGYGCPSWASCSLYRDGVSVGGSETDVLGAGTYNYTYNTTCSSNCSGIVFATNSLTITKAAPQILVAVNGTQTNATLAYPNAVNITAWDGNEGDDGCTYSLYDYSGLIGNGSSVESIALLGVGNYTYIMNTTGCANYSAGSVARSVSITKGTPSIALVSNITGWASVQQVWSNVTGYGCPEGLNCTLYRNGTLVAWNVSLPSSDIAFLNESYAYIYNTSGNANWTDANISQILSFGNACGNGVCDSGETTSICPTDCPVAPSNPPSSGTTSSSSVVWVAPTASREPILSTQSLAVQTVAGDNKKSSFSITNNGTYPMTVRLSVEGDIAPFVTLGSNDIVILPGQTKLEDVNLSISSNAMPGTYSGNIVVKYGTTTQKIYVTVAIGYEREQLLDVKVDVMTKDVPIEDSLGYQVSVFNFGQTKKVDVFINYTVRNSVSNETVALGAETVAVETSLSVARTIHIPDGTEPGTYTIEAVAYYENKTAYSVASFRVVRPLSTDDYVKSGIIVALAIAVVIAYERLCTRRKSIAKHHVRPKKFKAKISSNHPKYNHGHKREGRSHHRSGKGHRKIHRPRVRR